MKVPFLRSVVAASIAVFGLASGYAAGAQQPERPVTQIAALPGTVWTATSDAPRDLLTPLEGERHDRFIGRAKAGDIDIVFFGSTDTEMWMWQDRGRSVWDKAFESLKAIDFGTQGTRFESLQWRMRNGELDGYRAKLVVLQAQGDDEVVIRDGKFDDHVAKTAATIAEIRARQPQAKILQKPAFEVWAEVLQPWLDRFVR